MVGAWDGLKLMVGRWLGDGLGSALGHGDIEGTLDGGSVGSLVGIGNNIPAGLREDVG